MASKILIIILGMALINYLFRMLPLVVLSRIDLPEIIMDWLHFVPVAVLAAIVAQGIFIPENNIILSWKNIYLWSAIPCIAIAWKTKNLTYTLIVGMATMALIEYIK